MMLLIASGLRGDFSLDADRHEDRQCRVAANEPCPDSPLLPLMGLEYEGVHPGSLQGLDLLARGFLVPERLRADRPEDESIGAGGLAGELDGAAVDGDDVA